ncbi:TPA: hypothetical protein U5D93_002549 [Yersinia enterocolitica]|nr:hypothetical protein [Yersinia enterocolitica]
MKLALLIVIDRTIGSALLLKELETEVAAIMAPENTDARHIYVTMARN